MTHTYRDEDEIAWQKAQAVGGDAGVGEMFCSRCGNATGTGDDDIITKLPLTTEQRDLWTKKKKKQVLRSGRRRKRFILERLEEGEERHSKGSLSYDKAELQFIEVGLSAIVFFDAMMARGGDAVVALAKLLRQVRTLGDYDDAMAEAIADAELAIDGLAPDSCPWYETSDETD